MHLLNLNNLRELHNCQLTGNTFYAYVRAVHLLYTCDNENVFYALSKNSIPLMGFETRRQVKRSHFQRGWHNKSGRVNVNHMSTYCMNREIIQLCHFCSLCD